MLQSLAHRAKPTVLAAILVATGVPGIAQAQAADADRATARALARDAYEAQKRKDYATAADWFARADRLVHAPTLLLGLARAQVGLGELVEANETYRRIVREGVDPQAPAAFARAVEDASHEAASLEPRLAWVTIQVRGPASPAVRLDGTAVLASAIGVRRACNPGDHTVDVSAAQFGSVTRRFSIQEAGDETVELAMAPLPEPAAAETPESVPPEVASAPGAAQTTASEEKPHGVTAGVASLGVGLTGLFVGSVIGALALARHSSLSDQCPSSRCSPGLSGDVDTYHTLATASTVALVVGGLGTATGVTLLVTAPRSKVPVTAYAGLAGVGARGTF